MKSCCEHHHFNSNQARQCPFRKLRRITRNQVKVASCLVFILLAHGIAGTMDYEDELAAQAYAKPTQTAQGGNTK